MLMDYEEAMRYLYRYTLQDVLNGRDFIALV